MKNRRIVFITHAQFWNSGSGFWVRTRTVLSYLADRFQVHVYYLGNLTRADRDRLNAFPLSIRLTALARAEANLRRHWCEQIRQHEAGKPPALAYIVDRIQNSFILQALPNSAVKILDMHDLVYARTEKERVHKAPTHFSLTLEQEKQIMRSYSAVLCIQHKEHEIVRAWVGKDKALLVPHPVEPRPQPLNARVKTIGIVASGWHANVNGLRHFINRVWPKLADLELTLLIFGFIASRFQSSAASRIESKGFQPEIEDCYRQMDIAINPVYYGAGLKIKSVEAMSFGVPLVTTPEGASGLERYANHGLVVAGSDSEYEASLRRLATDMEFRKKIAAGGVDAVSRDFSPETCFAPLETFLNSIKT